MKLFGQVAVNYLLRPGIHRSAADHGGDHRVNIGCIGIEIVVDILLFIIDLVFSGLPEIRAEQAAAGVVKNAVNSAFGICNSEKAALAVGQARNLSELYDFTVTAFEKFIRAVICGIRYFFAALAGDGYERGNVFVRPVKPQTPPAADDRGEQFFGCRCR